MDDQCRQGLVQAGIDVPDALERLMGNEALLTRFLKQFLQDANYPALREAVEQGNQKQALTASHTLKGLCGNLSMVELYQLFTRQVELLRGENWQGACDLMPQIDRVYRKVCQAIEDALG